MILIAHRGNTEGPNPEYENSPAYIKYALSQGYDVEIDVWYMEGKWILGHDEPQYETDFNFLCLSNLWVHCKHYASLQQMAKVGRGINFFYHTDEDYVLTSQNWIWAYPGMKGGEKTICVLPESLNLSVEGFEGVCSDYVGNYCD